MSFSHLPPGRRVIAMIIQQSYYLRLRMAGFDDIEGDDPDGPLAKVYGGSGGYARKAPRPRGWGDEDTPWEAPATSTARTGRAEYFRAASAAAWKVRGEFSRQTIRRRKGWQRDRIIALAIADGKPRAVVMSQLRIGRSRYERVRRELEAKTQEELRDAQD